MPRNEYKIHPDVRNKYKEILNGNGRLIVKVSEDIGKQTSHKDGVSTSQIRRIFVDFKRRQYKGFDNNKIQLIRPKLAYIFTRHNKDRGIDLLLGTMDFLIEKVQVEADFENLVSLYESILAYHKKEGGR